MVFVVKLLPEFKGIGFKEEIFPGCPSNEFGSGVIVFFAMAIDFL